MIKFDEYFIFLIPIEGFLVTFVAEINKYYLSMRLHNIEDQKSLTPQMALEILKEGNNRFVENLKMHSNLLEQVSFHLLLF